MMPVGTGTLAGPAVLLSNSDAEDNRAEPRALACGPAPSRSRLRFARGEGVRVQETEPGTRVTGQVPVTTMAP